MLRASGHPRRRRLILHRARSLRKDELGQAKSVVGRLRDGSRDDGTPRGAITVGDAVLRDLRDYLKEAR